MEDNNQDGRYFEYRPFIAFMIYISFNVLLINLKSPIVLYKSEFIFAYQLIISGNGIFKNICIIIPSM